MARGISDEGEALIRIFEAPHLAAIEEGAWEGDSRAEAEADLARWSAEAEALGALNLDAELAGYAARRRGEPTSDCPRVSDICAAPAWRKGWIACDAAEKAHG